MKKAKDPEVVSGLKEQVAWIDKQLKSASTKHKDKASGKLTSFIEKKRKKNAAKDQNSTRVKTGCLGCHTGAENRKKVPGVEAGTSSYVRHTGGSINFGIHRKKMRDETWIDPTDIQFFERVHKLNKGKGEWCDARAKNVHEEIKC